MKRALIVYWSATGNTEKVAYAIRDGLKDAGIEVETVKTKGTEELDYFQFDLVCIGFPVHQFHPPEPMLKFLKGMHTKYVKEKRVLPFAPTVKGKYALIFCTWAGRHTGIGEALPAVKYAGQYFAHLGFTVIDEWYVVGELLHGEPQELPCYNINGKLGDIRGKPTAKELAKIRLNAKKLTTKI